MTWAFAGVFFFSGWLFGYSCGAKAVRREQEERMIDSAIACAERDSRSVRLVEVK